ncbi:UNVERIFIED_CONTAM: hypothetical protein Sradi_2662500 [Sesamum radiatum]|uniref:Secreted protein n=1 Tax=Sesamum radiatum TaxID=300843 RepID=A0AAW2S5Z7_SESRA
MTSAVGGSLTIRASWDVCWGGCSGGMPKWDIMWSIILLNSQSISSAASLQQCPHAIGGGILCNGPSRYLVCKVWASKPIT